jgi:hypothetical protein
MGLTPFDLHAAETNNEGYHNHRVNTHSDIVSDAIIRDLWKKCPTIHRDLENGKIGYWKNQKIDWGRGRQTDMVVAEPVLPPSRIAETKMDWHGAAATRGAKPRLDKVRIVVEHKSVITAHRNRDARHDDLNNLWQEASNAGGDVIVGATVMIGLAERYLNVPDRLKARISKDQFNNEVLPRLKAHDPKLFSDFPYAVSSNRPSDPRLSFDKFNTLPRRPPHRSKPGFDVLLLCPVNYDNVSAAQVARKNPFGIDVDAECEKFLQRICADYTRLWPS